MEIKAGCKFNYDAVKALTYVSMFKKADPKKRMLLYGIVFLALLAAAVLKIVLFGADFNIVMIGILSLVAFLLNAFMWFIYPRITYNALAKMKGAVNEYTFTDEKIFITSEGTDYNAKAEMEYTLLVSIYETSKYLFMYQTKNQVFIVDKSTLSGGTIEEIRGKLFPHIKKKYVICKY